MAWEAVINARSFGIELQVRWVSRADAKLRAADSASRAFPDPEPDEVDLDEWGVADTGFRRIKKFAGRDFAVDIFASQALHRAPAFFSRKPTDGALGLDAFAFPWGDLGFLHVCPPVHLVTEAIKKIITDSAEGVLIVPAWRAAPFWPSIAADGIHINRLFFRAARGRPRLCADARILSDTFKGRPTFDMLALRFGPVRGDARLPAKGAGRCLEGCCSSPVPFL